MKNWYLIHTKPKQETIAKDNLERQDYIVYLPMAVIRRKRRGKTVRVVEAMFPRYLFIHLSEQTDDWGPIRSSIGVSSLIRFGIEPARIPQTLIDALRARENSEGIHELPVKDFEQGQKVVISEGPFEGYEALFTSHEGNERVSLLLKIAGKGIKIQLKQSLIEPLT
jgi:transcriptional antiterminator RfaH